MAKCKNCKNIKWLSDISEDGERGYNWCPIIDDCPDPEAERNCGYYDEMTNADFDIETFWEELTALSKALQNAIRALMEIQQYRHGNLEEIRLKLGAFDQIKWERDIAIAQLTDIGCSLGEKMDDVVAAVERQKPRLLQAKKAYNKGYMINAYHCPTCNEQICFEGERRSTTISNTYKYCKKCGQAIDWGDVHE